jgi:hypothetical protein
MFRRMRYGTFFNYLVLSLGIGISAAALATVNYVVKPGDALSVIAAQSIPGTVWGKDGSLKTVMALNSKIQDPNLLWVGQVVQLPDEQPSQLREPAEIGTVVQEVLPSPSPSPSYSGTVWAPPPPELPSISLTKTIPDPDYGDERSLLKLAPQLSFNRINSTNRLTGGAATLGSSLSFGGELAWQQVWSKDWSSQITVQLSHFNEQTSGESLEQSNYTEGSAEFSLDYQVSSRFHLLTGVLADYSPFAQPIAGNSVTIDSVLIPEVQAGFSLGLAESKLFRFDGGLLVGLRGPAVEDTYRVNAGYDYKTFIQLQQTHGNSPVFAQFYFEHISQSTSTTVQTESVVGLTLGISFDLTPSAQTTELKRP